ncbi:hypothetical protein ABVY47_000518 [Vibrio parahaemolyticus]|nr:hypothetical protein [Vibrio parahaemolyticus]EQM49495.1 hypothetical protein D051_3943 [Vibrio parahaemolyticus VPCR-2010]EGQ7775803.1 hypothetical protein [Vibrio parahaemolyticus]EHK5109209.1 hypothetical protein [Vibrio parahaemolyticus]EII3015246.1 hypothetical protein [Vibrio parahaemolyticus]EII5691654.1 hypothetical protein [Vibrio parahaemolyticus]
MMEQLTINLRVIAKLMECEVLDDATKEFIQCAVMKAALLLEEAKFTNISKKDDS